MERRVREEDPRRRQPHRHGRRKRGPGARGSEEDRRLRGAKDRLVRRSEANGGAHGADVREHGRLFEAVSAICGLCARASFEGQAPMRLEGVASREDAVSYPFSLSEEGGQITVHWEEMIRGIVSACPLKKHDPAQRET